MEWSQIVGIGGGEFIVMEGSFLGLHIIQTDMHKTIIIIPLIISQLGCPRFGLGWFSVLTMSAICDVSSFGEIYLLMINLFDQIKCVVVDKILNWPEIFSVRS